MNIIYDNNFNSSNYTVFFLLLFQVIDHFSTNCNKEDILVHVINIDIQDNQEEATIGTTIKFKLGLLLFPCGKLLCLNLGAPHSF